MSDKKVFVVFGATGNQGGSVINSVLSDPSAAKEFRLRGITRDPSKPNAQALTARGVECVTGDINDKASLTRALQGAHSVYAVTNYWEKMDAELELQQGKNIADVCKVIFPHSQQERMPFIYHRKFLNEKNPQDVGVQHLIWSGLIDVKKLTSGKYSNVYHFDSKAHITEYIRSIGLPSSTFMPGFYMSNLESMMNPSPQPPHSYTFAQPMKPSAQIPFFDAAADTGKFVKAMLMKRDRVLGKNVLAATDYYSADDVPKILEKVNPTLGKGAQYVTIDAETFKGFLTGAGMPDFAALEMYENMAFMDEFGYYGKEGLEWSLSLLDEKPTTLEEYFAKTAKWNKSA
ncbi:MAG: hypothetical protein L6R41_008000 [Letrouitia leprolyta]|nr:MAG: hypothetical protein L6R41_008000 [Letrouitia leprolyta]